VTSAPIADRQRAALAFSRLDIAIVAYAVSGTLMAWGLTVAHDRPYALLALVPAALALVFRNRPILAGVCIGSSVTILRLAYMGIGYSTQIDHARAAAARAIEGMTPYGVLIPAATTPPEPYLYGPLGLIWWQPGVVVELFAAIAVTALLIRTRSWLTLAVYSGLPFSVYLTTTGVNDYSPGLLIAGALLLMRTRRVAGAGLLAIAAAIKPYAFAWFLPAIGYGGWTVTALLVGLTAAFWSPLLFWGPANYVRSVQLHGAAHPTQENALNLPILRWLAVPLSVLGLLMRRWDHAVLLGSAVFVAYLFLDRWASLGYWLAVIPAAGIAIENRWART
jgi:hypothetical protein